MKNTLAITKKPHRNALATTPLVLNTVTFYSVKKPFPGTRIPKRHKW